MVRKGGGKKEIARKKKSTELGRACDMAFTT